jgi:lipoprotein-anchoring transpeptidase ErfK/SrfK
MHMHMRIARLLICFAALTAIADASTQRRPQRSAPQKKTAHAPAARKTAAPRLPCGDYLAFQVLLDRQGFSPGQIDGRPGVNFTHAIAALQTSKQLTPTGTPDCDTWKALGGDSAEAPTTTYTITEADLKGPFEKQIPRKLDEQAHLPALAYQSPLEELAERFHASPGLLQQLNPRMSMTEGTEIKVPNVSPFQAGTKPAAGAAANDVTITVSRDDSALRATRADGTVVLFAPVTTGSAHDPLPTGDYKVTGVSWNPVFHYNPDLFWDAKATDTKATIKAGPNNPVGVVWISLSLEHYGLHGTPEPGHIGHTESHGCVRMTNWDAARVAAMVKPGTPVLFR